jgi:hypothetical protein
MIIALLALAFAMILGGLLATILGWDIVLVERGWTMVIAGCISATSGALLLGITAAVSKLGKIQIELERLQGDLEGLQMAEEQQPTGDLSLAALSGGLLGGAASGTGDARPRDEEQAASYSFDRERGNGRETATDEAERPAERPEASEPVRSVLPFPSRPPSEAASVESEEVSGMKVPEFLIGDRVRDRYEEVRIFDPGPSPLDSEAEAQGTRERPNEDLGDGILEPAAGPAAAPAEEDVSPPEREPEKAAEETAPEETDAATIIGTYNSGDNRYVMFSDGSIEAQTPRGVFRFQSLDELKEFIAAGGEGGSSAAI